jgi:molybdopterin converting factor small subunit
VNDYGDEDPDSDTAAPFTDKLDAVELDGQTVGELLQSLTTKYGALKHHLYTADGRLRSFVNIYVNDEDIRYLQKEATPAEGRRHGEHHPVGGRRQRRRGGAALPQLSPTTKCGATAGT